MSAINETSPHRARSESDQIATLLKLYRPNVSRGNYMADVSWRGANEMLRNVAVALGLATGEVMDEHFRRLDDESYARSQARIAAIESEATAGAAGQAEEGSNA